MPVENAPLAEADAFTGVGEKGSIGLIGLPGVGKTALLYSIYLTQEGEKSGRWQIAFPAGALRDYLNGLGDKRTGLRPKWAATDPAMPHRSFHFMEVQRIVPLLPNSLFKAYDVFVPDMPGELFVILAGDPKERPHPQQRAARMLLNYLRSASALVCLLDITKDSSTIYAQVEALRSILAKVQEDRSSEGPLILSLGLTKSDVLVQQQQNRISLPREESHLVRLLLEEGHRHPERFGVEFDGDIATYLIEDMDGQQDDPERDQAVAWDYLQCYLPHVAQAFRALCETGRFDVCPVLFSSWGGPLPKDEAGNELVPRRNEIHPRRVLGPFRVVLDKLDAGGKSQRSLRLVATAFSVAALLLLLLFQSVPIMTWRARTQLNDGDLSGAAGWLDRLNAHWIVELDREKRPADVVALAQLELDYSERLAPSGSRSDASVDYDGALAAVHRAINLDVLELTTARARQAQLIRERMLGYLDSNDPWLALEKLEGMRGKISPVNDVLDGVIGVVIACNDSLRRSMESPDRKAGATKDLSDRLGRLEAFASDLLGGQVFSSQVATAEFMRRSVEASRQLPPRLQGTRALIVEASGIDIESVRQQVAAAVLLARNSGDAAALRDARQAVQVPIEERHLDLLRKELRFPAASFDPQQEDKAVMVLDQFAATVVEAPSLRDRADETLCPYIGQLVDYAQLVRCGGTQPDQAQFEQVLLVLGRAEAIRGRGEVHRPLAILDKLEVTRALLASLRADRVISVLKEARDEAGRSAEWRLEDYPSAAGTSHPPIARADIASQLAEVIAGLEAAIATRAQTLAGSPLANVDEMADWARLEGTVSAPSLVALRAVSDCLGTSASPPSPAVCEASLTMLVTSHAFIANDQASEALQGDLLTLGSRLAAQSGDARAAGELHRHLVKHSRLLAVSAVLDRLEKDLVDLPDTLDAAAQSSRLETLLAAIRESRDRAGPRLAWLADECRTQRKRPEFAALASKVWEAQKNLLDASQCEAVFVKSMEAVRNSLSTGSGVLTADEREVVQNEILHAEKLGATEAGLALTAALELDDVLRLRDTVLMASPDGSAFHVSRDEVSVHEYTQLVASDPELEIHQRAAGTDVSLTAAGADSGYDDLVGHSIDAGVYFVSFVQARRAAALLGGRLPSQAEWNRVAKSYLTSKAATGFKDLPNRPVSGKMLGDLHDEWNGVRGLAGGLSEWVELAPNLGWLAGPSWRNKSYSAEPNVKAGDPAEARIDAGFRVYFDAVPGVLTEFLKDHP
jgi:hypothetical protein